MKHRQLPEWQHNLHVLWLNNFIIGMGFQLIMPFMALYIRQLGNFTRFQLNMWSGGDVPCFVVDGAHLGKDC